METECFLMGLLGGREARDWVDSIPSLPICNATGWLLPAPKVPTFTNVLFDFLFFWVFFPEIPGSVSLDWCRRGSGWYSSLESGSPGDSLACLFQ